MLSSVLHSDVAIKANIGIMRAFVQIRRLGMTIVDVKRKIDNMEKKYEDNSWREAIGQSRQEIGDFACRVHCLFGLLAR